MSKPPLISSLSENFYAKVPFDIPYADIEQAIGAFFHFLNLDDDVKYHIDFSIAPKHRRGDIGFKHRTGEGSIYEDQKDFFHYHPAIFEKYSDFLGQHSIVRDFMVKADNIWKEVEKTVAHVLKELDQFSPGAYDKVFAVDKNRGENVHIMLRFLSYAWSSAGKYLAKPHFDAGSFTLGIAESAPGLRIGSHPHNLKPVEHEEGFSLFMCSSNVKKVLDTLDLKPGWHDVIQLDEKKIGKPFARWAVVAFIEALDVEALSKEETHKYFTAAVA